MGRNLMLASVFSGLSSCDAERPLVWDLDHNDGGVVTSTPSDVFAMRFDGSEDPEVSTTCEDIRSGIPFVYDSRACGGRQPEEGDDCLENERFCVLNDTIVPFPSFEGGYGEGREANIRVIRELVRCSFAGLDPWVVFSGDIGDAEVNQLFFGGFGAPDLPGYTGFLQKDPKNVDHTARILVPEWMPVDDMASIRLLPCHVGYSATRGVAQALGVDFGPEGSGSFRWPREQMCAEPEAWDFSPEEARILVENTAGENFTAEQRAEAVDSLTSIGVRCRAEIDQADPF